MINYVAILTQNPDGVLATKSDDGLSTRIIHFVFADGNKVYFCTNKEKRLYAQIIKNPQVSFCTRTADFSQTLSVNGNAVTIDDIKLKERVLAENPQIKDIYKSADNPLFTMFYIDVKEIQTFSFAEKANLYKI